MTNYRYSGYVGEVIAVYLPADQGGTTVIVFRADGSVHPNYSLGSPLAQQWIADTPNWQAVLAALPQPEPEPEPTEEVSNETLIAFQLAIATNPGYQEWFNAVSVASPILADSIPLTILQKQFQITQGFLAQALSAVSMPPEVAQDLQTTINQYGIPLTLS